jgi:TRAP-type transport system periplasmic protein
VKKLSLLLIGILIITALVLSGCGSQPAPTSVPPTSSAPAKTSTALTTIAVPASSTTAPSQASAQAASPGKVIELRFSHHAPPTGWTTVQFLNAWAKKVEEATKGQIKITMYPAQSIASMADNYDATISGLADMTWVPSSPYQGRFPLSEVITLPFLSLPSGNIGGRKVSAAAANSHIIQELYENTPEIQKEFSQVKVLFLHTTDPFFLLGRNKPIRNAQDLKGLKTAVLGPSSIVEMYKRLGASPQYLTGPAIYESGQKGVIDATTANWANLGTYRYNEVFPYAVDINSYVVLFMLVMNLEKWNSLSPDLQKQVMSVSGVLGAEFAGDNAHGSGAQQDVMARIKQAGTKLEINAPDAGEFDKWKSLAGKPVWDDWVAQLKAKGLASDKVLNEAIKLADKYK